MSVELIQRLGIDCVSDVVRKTQLIWFGHVERNDDDEWVKACQRFEVAGERGRGRSRKTWKECVEEDMRMLGLEVRDTKDRPRWRKGILGEPSDPCKHGRNRR